MTNETPVERLRELALLMRRLEGQVRQGLWQPTLAGEDNAIFDHAIYEASSLLTLAGEAGRRHSSQLNYIVHNTRNPLDHAATLDGIRRVRMLLATAANDIERHQATAQQIDSRQAAPEMASFIDPGRLDALRDLKSAQFDLQRLVRLLEELELAFKHGSFQTVAALTRAVIDHVPPIFGLRSFSEVANNYAGTKSFRESMQHLDASARRIGDAHLHGQIRQREVLPTRTQTNFSNDLDVLLGEIIRILT